MSALSVSHVAPAYAKAGPIEVDFNNPLLEIVGIIVIVLGIYAGVRVIQRLVPNAPKRR
jgi:uncharacterized membrane protein YfcA